MSKSSKIFTHQERATTPTCTYLIGFKMAWIFLHLVLVGGWVGWLVGYGEDLVAGGVLLFDVV